MLREWLYRHKMEWRQHAICMGIMQVQTSLWTMKRWWVQSVAHTTTNCNTLQHTAPHCTTHVTWVMSYIWEKHWLTKDCSGGFMNPLQRNKWCRSKLYLRFMEIFFVVKFAFCFSGLEKQSCDRHKSFEKRQSGDWLILLVLRINVSIVHIIAHWYFQKIWWYQIIVQFIPCDWIINWLGIHVVTGH